MRRSSIAAICSVLAPFALYLAHALFFGDWIVDDAGITFAYARNVALGFGAVSQPGMPPVEGFSNPAWMLLLVPFFWLGAFDPVVTPKAIAAVLVLATFVQLRRVVGRLLPRPDLAAGLGLWLIAANPSFVIWSCSGLENPLYALLVASSTVAVIGDLEAAHVRRAQVLMIGAIAGLLAITRPDGVMFALGYPVLLLSAPWLTPDPRPARALSRTLVYALGFAAIAGSYFVFRLTYYGEPVPNTFYAKGSQMAHFDLARLKEIVRRVWALLWSLGGPGAVLLAGFVAARCTWLAVRRRLGLPLLGISTFVLLAFALFVLLPADWMPEGRFATPLITLFCPFGSALLVAALRALPARWLAPTIVAAVLAAGWAFVDFAQRSRAFRADPTISLQSVTEHWALPYNQLVDEFGLRDASALIPDLGGTLFYCKLRIYDLAYLCDRTIARTLGGKTYDSNTPENLARFYDYVFAEIKPTFIRSHSVWTDNSRLFNDPRLERDYHLLYRKLIPPTEWLGPWHVLDYVRKDAVPGDFEVFERRYLEVMPHLRGS